MAGETIYRVTKARGCLVSIGRGLAHALNAAAAYRHTPKWAGARC